MEPGLPTDPPPTVLRANGLLIAFGVVLLGIVPGAGYLQWRWPQVRAEIADRMAKAPSEPGERLDFWLSFGEPQIQSRLTQLRFSAAHPWLVTHTVRVPGGAPEIWGLDLRSPSPARVEREGLRVELHFPAPVLLGHGTLGGDNAEHVPAYEAGAGPEQRAARAQELLEWFLSGMIEALPQDIPGAELAIVVDPPLADVGP
jgi:hypothetical protein